MRWLVDFAEAEKVGMGIRVALTPELATGTLDTLLVLGVNAKLAPDAGSAALEAVLDAQRYTRGLAFVAPGTATNNTADGGTGLQPPRPHRGPELRERARRGEGRLGSRGRRASARDPSRDARRPRRRRPHVTSSTRATSRRRSGRSPAATSSTRSWARPTAQPATFTDAQLDAARRYFVDSVRALGPAPTLRAGRQPYGVLPVTSLELSRRRGCAGPLRRQPALPARRVEGGAPGVPRARARRRPGRARRGAAAAAGVGRLLGAARVRQPVLRADDRLREPAQPAPPGPRER